MPPRTPKKNPPVAVLNLAGQIGRTVSVSTLGTSAGSTGQGRNKTPSQLSGWKIYWGDTQLEAGTGFPPSTLTHTYDATVGDTAYIQFIVTDVNTLTATATLTITGMGQLPATPANLTASPVGPTAILLDWEDPLGNALTFTIEQALAGTNAFGIIGTVAAPTTTFTATGLTPATAYDFRVSATNNQGISGSTIASATTDPAFTPPAAPTLLIATAFSTTQINLAWTDNSAGTASFEIQRKLTVGGTYATVATVAAGVVTYSDLGLTPALSYTYRVRAVSIGGASAYSNESAATTNTAAPAAPTNLTATPLSTTSILVNWVASVGATSYTLERSPHTAGTFVSVATPTAPPVTDTGLVASTSYDYRVKATGPGGDSAYSSIASATTFATPPPTAPTSLTATPISTTQINLAWTDNAGGTASFEIERKLGAGSFALVATVAAGITTFANTGLASASSYTYRVRAVNINGASGYSNEATALTLTAAPAAPTNLTATPTSTTAIDVTWALATGATTYTLQRSLHNAGVWTQVGSPVAAPPVSDSGLTANTAYDYRVFATNAGGNSPFSTIASATTFPVIPPPPPIAPSGLSATVISPTQVNLAWVDNSSDEANFEIERKIGAGSFVLIATVAAGVIAYNNTGLTSATTYTYRVRATNGAGASAYSNEFTVTTQTAAPAAPTNLVATVLSTSSISLSWTASVGAVTYQLERSLRNANTFTVIATQAGTSFTDTGLASATAYDYRVRATNAGGSSAYSAITTATTFTPPPLPPAAPSLLTASPISTTQINLAWQDNATNETNYEIERRLGSGSYVLIATVAAGVISYSNTGLSPASTYTFRIRATNGAGASAYSNESTATTLTAPPAAPTNLTATPLSTTSIGVNWTASAGAVSYSLERSPHSAGTFVVIATQAGVGFTDTGLTQSTAYDYRVRASNAGGNSPYSSIASATTFTQPPPPTPPAAPSALLAVSISDTQINLAWTDNSTDETSFEIQRRLGSGSYATIATVSAGVTAYQNTGLLPNTIYTYQVRAVNAGGASAYSNESTALTSPAPPPPIPAAPSGLTALNPTQSSLQISWTDNSTIETGFSLERAVGNGTFALIQTLAPNIVAYLDQVLTAATTYRYRIRAFNANGNSAYSNIATNTTLAAPPVTPAPPTNLVGTQIADQAVRLTWVDNSSNEVGFPVERRVAGVGNFVQLSQTAQNVATYQDNTVAIGAVYDYRVKAINAAGSSAYTNVVTVAVQAAPPANVISQSDFTYLGALRMPQTGVDTFGSGSGGITGREISGRTRLFIVGSTANSNTQVVSGSSPSVFSVPSLAVAGQQIAVGTRLDIKRAASNQALPAETTVVQSINSLTVTVSPALGATPQAGDLVRIEGEAIYELLDPEIYNPDYTQSARTTLVKNWGDVYQGRKCSWNPDGSFLMPPSNNTAVTNLYWHEGNQLLYWGYSDGYNNTVRPDWSLGATALISAGTIPTNPTDSVTQAYGPWRLQTIDGFGNVRIGTSRTAFIYPGRDGLLAGHGAYFVSTQSPWGPQCYGGLAWPTASTPSAFGNPTLSVPDRYLDYYFMGVSDPAAPYYTGNYFTPTGTVTGVNMAWKHPFTLNRPYFWEAYSNGDGSGAPPRNATPPQADGNGLDQPVVSANPAFTGYNTWAWANGLAGMLWITGATKQGVLFVASIVGSPDQNIASVNAAHTWYANSAKNAACQHGFTIPDVPTIAGPVTTARFPAWIIYDQATLLAVKAGSQTDYLATPARVVDLSTTYGIKFDNSRASLRFGAVSGVYFSPRTKRLYCLCLAADNTRVPGDPNVRETLIHVWQFTDVVAPPATTRGPVPTQQRPSGAVDLLPGANIQTAINTNPAGTTFWLRAGVFPITASITPRTGNSFVGEYGATLDGATWPRPESDLDAAPFKGINNSVTNVTIRNLIIRNMPSYGVNAYLSAATWVVDHCEIDHNRNGVSLGFTSTLSNNKIHHNAGINNDPNPALRGGGYVFTNPTNLQFINNEIAYNGQEQKSLADPGRPGLNQHLTVIGNWFHHNVADGFWIDGDGAGSLIEDNTTENNGRTGITLENAISVTVRNNTARNNIAGEGILLTVSRDCTLTGNIVAGNLFGIGLFLNFDSLPPVSPAFPWGQDLRNNTISGNTITVPSSPANAYASMLTFAGAGDQTPYLTNTKNNVYAANTYFAPTTGGIWFLWGGNKTFTTWQAVPQDAGATIAVG